MNRPLLHALSTSGLAALLAMGVIANSSAETIDLDVTTGNDDGFEDSGGDLKLGDDELELAKHPWVGVRFQGVTVPSGATITNAYLEFAASSEQENTFDITIYAEDVDDAGAFSGDNYFSNRTLTSASVGWVSGDWDDGDTIYTPGLTSVIQEVVDRAGWSSGGSIAVLFGSNDTSKQQYAWARDKNANLGPKLHVEYTFTSIGELLFVRAGSSYTTEEQSKVTQFESWGWTVTPIEDSDSQANFDAALTSADVVYVPVSVANNSIGYKLRTATVGVVHEGVRYWDDGMGWTTDTSHATGTTTSVTITNDTHPVTSTFSTGSLTIYSSSTDGYYADIQGFGTPPGTELAYYGIGNTVVSVLETGDALANTYSGNSTASGRRVRLPYSANSTTAFSWSNLTSDSLQLIQNSLDWAASGAGGGGGGGASSSVFYLSTVGGAEIGGLSFSDEDIVAYDNDADSATLHQDGTTPTGGTDVDALHLNPDGTMLLSLNNSGTIGGVAVEDEDVVEYDPSTDTAVMVFEGDSVFENDEEVDAVCRLRNGNLIISTGGDATIGGLSIENGDLVEYNPKTGAASIYLDEDAVFAGNTRIVAAHVKTDGKILLSTSNDETIGSLNFGDDDIVEYDPETGTATIVVDGGDRFTSSSEDIDALSIDPEWVGLLAHWKFDEGSGSTVADDSGNGHDASFGFGAPAWTTGVRDDGLEFNGYSDVETDADFDPPGGGAIAFWFRSDAVAWSSESLLGATDSFEIWRDSDGLVRFDLGGDGESGGLITTNAMNPPGRWRHVIVQYESLDDSYEIYLDGQLHKSGVSTVDLQDVASSSFSIGTVSGGFDFFSGQLDDVRIYDRWMSQKEIAEVYGLVGHWELDETSGAVAYDSSGAGNDATIPSSPTWATGVRDGAVELTGSDYFTNESIADQLNGYDGFSAAMWVKSDVTDVDRGVFFSQTPSGADDAPGIRYDKDGASGGGERLIKASVGSDSTYTQIESSTEAQTTSWQHLVMVWRSGGAIDLYIDGVLDATTYDRGPIGGNLAEIDRLLIGVGAKSSAWDGLIDDVRIYNRAITHDEIAEIYGLVGHWNFEETAGTVAADSSLVGNDGEYWGLPTLAQEGAVGYAVELDGFSDHVDVPASESLDTVDVSVAAWVYLPAIASGYQTIIEHGRETNNWYGLWKSGNGDYFHFRWANYGTDTWTDSTATIAAGKWHHVVGTYDSTSNDAKLYVDGELDTTVSSGLTPTTLSSAVRIGVHAGDDEYWGGRVDDVRVYNRAITPEEVLGLYNGGSTGGLRVLRWAEVR